MSEYNTPIAKLGVRVLIAKESDLPKIGTSYSMDVLVEQWDLKKGMLEGVFKLEELVKFNPWEDVMDANDKDKITREVKILKMDSEENREIKLSWLR